VSNQNMTTLKNSMTVILILLAFLLSRSAFALEIKYSHVDPFDGGHMENESLLLTGEIMPGDYDSLLRVISNDLKRFLSCNRSFVLASLGGDIQEAMKIARFVKGFYAKTIVGAATGRCASACFFIFASGAHRIAGAGTVGIHRPYVHPRRLASLSPSQAEALQKDLFRQARLYLQELQIPTNIIDTMFQRASSEVYWLSDVDLDEKVGICPPWFEQYLIGRCGLDGSTQQMKQKYLSTADRQSLANHLKKVVACGDRLTEDEAIDFLAHELVEFEKLGKR
jgi:hypothetical protein